MTEKPHTPDNPRKPDLRAFGQAVRFRDQATRAAVAHHERCGLPPSGQYARATFDAISELIREDERARMVADGGQPSTAAENTRLRDANDTLALTLAEAIGTLVPDGGGYSTRVAIDRATVDRWRRALHEAETAQAGDCPRHGQLRVDTDRAEG